MEEPPGFSTEVPGELENIEKEIRATADNTERAASADERVILRSELRELEARAWLSQHLKEE